MAKTSPTHDRAYEAALQPYPAARFEIDLQRIACEAESACEFDPHGGPPVVVVNWAGATVITSAFDREVFWAGVTLSDVSAYNLLTRLSHLHQRYMKARPNLNELINNVGQVLLRCRDGIAIVNTMNGSLAALQRAKCEERGHLIQFALERKARSCASGLGWYEDLYERPEAQFFVAALRRSGQTLYRTDDKILIVNELAMKINNGEWRFYGIGTDEAKVWIAAYFREVRRNLGRETLLMFRSILVGRVAKAGFREAVLDCKEAGIPS